MNGMLCLLYPASMVLLLTDQRESITHSSSSHPSLSCIKFPFSECLLSSKLMHSHFLFPTI